MPFKYFAPLFLSFFSLITSFSLMASTQQENHFQIGPQLLYQNKSQPSKLFHLLGYERKQSGLLFGPFIEYERKHPEMVFIHMDFSVAKGNETFSLNSQRGKIGDGETKTTLIQSQLLSGYSFYLNDTLVTPYGGLNFNFQKDKFSDSYVQYKNNKQVGESYFNHYQLMFILGLKAEKEINAFWRGGLNVSVQRSLYSKTMANVTNSPKIESSFFNSTDGRITTDENTYGFGIEGDLSYQYQPHSTISITPSYQYAHTTETYLSAPVTAHSFGIKMGLTKHF